MRKIGLIIVTFLMSALYACSQGQSSGQVGLQEAQKT